MKLFLRPCNLTEEIAGPQLFGGYTLLLITRKTRERILVDHACISVAQISVVQGTVTLSIQAPFALRVIPAERLPADWDPKRMAKDVEAKRVWQIERGLNQRAFVQAARNSWIAFFLSIEKVDVHHFVSRGAPKSYDFVRIGIEASPRLSVARFELL